MIRSSTRFLAPILLSQLEKLYEMFLYFPEMFSRHGAIADEREGIHKWLLNEQYASLDGDYVPADEDYAPLDEDYVSLDENGAALDYMTLDH